MGLPALYNLEGDQSSLYHVSCRITMSVFPISLMKSGFLLFRPKADNLRSCIFQDEIVKALCYIVCSVVSCLSFENQNGQIRLMWG